MHLQPPQQTRTTTSRDEQAAGARHSCSATTGMDNSERAQRAVEWFDQAHKHIQAAKLISQQRCLGFPVEFRRRGLEPLVIFHLQQALEMSVKGLARASGYSHYDKVEPVIWTESGPS